MALMPTFGSSETRPTPPPHDDLAASGHPGWVVDARSGCWVWNADPLSVVVGAWSGPCVADGRAAGRGVLEWRWGVEGQQKVERYEGEHRDGKKNGHGVYTFANGSRYEGEYRDGKYHGRGVFMFASGNRYESEFRDGKRGGRGVFILGGNRYEGQFQDGKYHGLGVLILANGNCYEGQFRDGKPLGRGLYTLANGERHECELLVVETFANGERYDCDGNRLRNLLR